MKIKKENLKKVKIKDILKPKTVHENEKKLALMQVLNLSMPEILLNKEKILTNKEQKKYIPSVVLIPSSKGSLGIGIKKVNDNVEKAVGVNIL